MNGTLYAPGSIIARVLLVLLLLLSIYYFIYANSQYKLPHYFKALNALVLMFTLYGTILILSGQRIFAGYEVLSNTEYLKAIYRSLLPIYAFYVFAKKGLLTEKVVKRWFFVFLILAVWSFYEEKSRLLRLALEVGSMEEEFTNNSGYTFVALLPTLVLFSRKPFLQYVLLFICILFLILSMKRGAVLSGAVCFVWLMIDNLKNVQKKRKMIVWFVSAIVVLAGVYLVNYMMQTSDYFQLRLSETQAGDSSGRDKLYSTFYSHFIHEDNPLLLLFGNGANATLKISYNYAHNDWLELAINQGAFGVVIYSFYWICFYKTWKNSKSNFQGYRAIGMIFVIYFMSTFFSMSYNSVSRCAAMTLGYFLAMSDKKVPLLSKVV